MGPQFPRSSSWHIPDVRGSLLAKLSRGEYEIRVPVEGARQRGVSALCAATFQNGELLARALVEKFDADIRMHPGGCSTSTLSDKVEQVWEYGRVSVPYRLLPDTQHVEVLSVYETRRVSGLRQWGLYFLHIWHRHFRQDKPTAQQKD
jgi:hypothetical protein